MTTPKHVPVLLDRVVELLSAPLEASQGDGVIVDATLGLGGHAEAMLQRFGNVRVIGVDRDPQALDRARARLADFEPRISFVHAVYDDLAEVVSAAGLSAVDAVLFDLGVSSMQLDVADRGFAYAQDAPLDMRMNPTTGITAADVLNTYEASELARVLRQYGEEKFARRIADTVVAERVGEPFDTSARLVDLIRRSIPAAARRTGGNPAKRTFQALRIEVNDELGVYRRALPAALSVVRPGGRVVVMSYHSLEDRLTKRAFTEATSTQVPRGLPFIPEGHTAGFRTLTRGAERASATEIEQNPRAQSVRLRAVERIAA